MKKISKHRDNTCESNVLKEKKEKGQFYTTNYNYILNGFGFPVNQKDKKIIEPFAGRGDLINWIKEYHIKIPIEAYDIDPKNQHIIHQDTLINPPDYTESWIITNPPYLAKNKTKEKDIFDKYSLNDLYKCFIKSICMSDNQCLGGIIIIPAGFFFGTRKSDCGIRNEFMSIYKIIKIKYFEETVFSDTTTTVVAISFEKSDTLLKSQLVEWCFLPTGNIKLLNMDSDNDWVIGGEIYNLPTDSKIKIKRYIEGIPLKKGDYLTSLTLNALDNGKDKYIKLEFIPNYIYPAKNSSRTYATIITNGVELNSYEQEQLADSFNNFLNSKRKEYNSLFLPQYRESKEYARKRIPFELAYSIINFLLIKNSN